MIFGVKKANFWIYISMFAVGIVLIAISVFIFAKCCNELYWDEIFMGIGCSLFPTVVVAYLIDFANEKRKIERIKSLRETAIWRMSYGLLLVAKIVIEEFGKTKNENNKSFADVYKESINKMKHTNPLLYLDVNNINDRKNLMLRLEFGLSMCESTCSEIINNSVDYKINGIYSEDEINILKSLISECNHIRVSSIITDTADFIEQLLNVAIDGFPEIKAKMKKTIIINKGVIKNLNEMLNN